MIVLTLFFPNNYYEMRVTVNQSNLIDGFVLYIDNQCNKLLCAAQSDEVNCAGE